MTRGRCLVTPAAVALLASCAALEPSVPFYAPRFARPPAVTIRGPVAYVWTFEKETWPGTVQLAHVFREDKIYVYVEALSRQRTPGSTSTMIALPKRMIGTDLSESFYWLGPGGETQKLNVTVEY
jgi:hypothetical protein